MKIREADFAMRVVRRVAGDAAVVYRRRLDDQGRERLQRLGTISPLAYSAGAPLIRAAVRNLHGSSVKLAPGPFFSMDEDWGARVACYAILCAGLRDADRLHRAASHLQHADGTEAAWWLGLMTRPDGGRAIRALRILTEAVQ